MKTLDNKAESNPAKKGPDQLDENDLSDVAGGLIGPTPVVGIQTLEMRPGQFCDVNTMEMKPGQPIDVITLETKPNTGLGLFKSKKRGKRKTASSEKKIVSI